VSPEPGFFEAFYASPLQHPILLWLAALLALGIVMTRRGLHVSLRGYCIGLVLLSLCDAWLTTSEVFGLGALTGQAASAVPLFFVLAGDLRFLALVMLARPDGSIRFDARAFATALGLTAIVPISSQLLLSALPEDVSSPRLLFLVYEVAFVLLTIALLQLRDDLRENAWMCRVSRFVIVYYSLWASADVLILVIGTDLGFALRVVPNLLYYGGLIAVIAAWSPGVDQDRKGPVTS
jgi:hypothetical protein